MVGTGEKKIVIDTGQGVPKYIEELKENVDKIECVICTHHHHDHIGGVADIKSTYGDIPIYKYKIDSDSDEFLNLSIGQQFITEGCTLTIIHTPGHSVDSISIYLEEEKAIFTGDIILGTGSTLLNNYTQYLESMEKLLNLHAEILYPAHGESKVSALKISQDLDHRKQREYQILAVLDESLSLEEITFRVYGNIAHELIAPATNNARLYLNHLLSQGYVSELNGKWEKIKNQ